MARKTEDGKIKFGILNIEVKYGVLILDENNPTKGKWVTKVEYSPRKCYEYKDGEKAYFFNDRESAEDFAAALNLHCVPGFVVEIPMLADDYYDNFENVEDK